MILRFSDLENLSYDLTLVFFWPLFQRLKIQSKHPNQLKASDPGEKIILVLPKSSKTKELRTIKLMIKKKAFNN